MMLSDISETHLAIPSGARDLLADIPWLRYLFGASGERWLGANT